MRVYCSHKQILNAWILLAEYLRTIGAATCDFSGRTQGGAGKDLAKWCQLAGKLDPFKPFRKGSSNRASRVSERGTKETGAESCTDDASKGNLWRTNCKDND